MSKPARAVPRRRRRPARLIAPARDDSRLWLPAIAGAMAFLAALALSAALVAGEFATRWRAGLEGKATVELAGDADDATVAATLDVLVRDPAVRGAVRLERAEVARLIEPFLGALQPHRAAHRGIADENVQGRGDRGVVGVAGELSLIHI